MESELVWYYIKDGQKVGPISMNDVQQLIQVRQLKPSDLVWKNGLENWIAISEVPELNAPAPAAGAPQPAANPAAALPNIATQQVPRHRAPMSFDAGPLAVITTPMTFMRPIMQPLLLLGMIMVIGGKGCDALSLRWVAMIQAKANSVERDFDNEWAKKLNDNQALQDNITSKDDIDQDDLDRLEDLQEKEDKLREDMLDERRELEMDEWFDKRVAAESAMDNHRAQGLYREALFIFGTFVLSIALLVAGFTETGSSRWVCLIMLVVIVFSIYVGGASWISSIAGSMDF